MFNVNEKAVKVAIELLYMCGLSGAAVLITSGWMLEALLCSLISGACLLILTGAAAISKIIQLKVKRLIGQDKNSCDVPKEIHSKD